MASPPYPLVPAPSTYVNGPVTASELTADMTNGVTFLSNRPVFSAYNSEGPAILTSAATTGTATTATSVPASTHVPPATSTAHPPQTHAPALLALAPRPVHTGCTMEST